jgi:regulator of sirC expression with transglutaminase-like and TPR domain
VNHLRQLLADENAKGRLDRAAFELASIHFPTLEPEPFLDQLNDLASQLGDRLRNFNDGRDFVEKAQSYLFGELGFRGNESDFFNPLNSCLNQVLERRTGIPITLSVLYMEIGRRLAMPVFGINLPRHFIVQFDDGNYAAYIDPFYGGRTITPQECFALAGAQAPDPALLQRVSQKQIVMRMLQNLHDIYLRGRDSARAIQTLDLLILGAPEVSAGYRSRGLLLLESKRLQAARKDLERYLALEPEAADREQIRKQIGAIHQWLARVN